MLFRHPLRARLCPLLRRDATAVRPALSGAAVLVTNSPVRRGSHNRLY